MSDIFAAAARRSEPPCDICGWQSCDHKDAREHLKDIYRGAETLGAGRGVWAIARIQAAIAEALFGWMRFET